MRLVEQVGLFVLFVRVVQAQQIAAAAAPGTSGTSATARREAEPGDGAGGNRLVVWVVEVVCSR